MTHSRQKDKILVMKPLNKPFNELNQPHFVTLITPKIKEGNVPLRPVSLLGLVFGLRFNRT